MERVAWMQAPKMRCGRPVHFSLVPSQMSRVQTEAGLGLCSASRFGTSSNLKRNVFEVGYFRTRALLEYDLLATRLRFRVARTRSPKS